MRVIFTNSFKKRLFKLGNISEKNILELVKKFPNTKNLIEISKYDDLKILKGYLFSKKIRILIFFQEINGIFVPFFIGKKETKEGRNIYKDNIFDLFGNDIDKNLSEIEEKKFEEIEFKDGFKK